MENPTGESADGVLRLDFDRRLMLQFRGSVVAARFRAKAPGLANRQPAPRDFRSCP